METYFLFFYQNEGNFLVISNAYQSIVCYKIIVSNELIFQSFEKTRLSKMYYFSISSGQTSQKREKIPLSRMILHIRQVSFTT